MLSTVKTPEPTGIVEPSKAKPSTIPVSEPTDTVNPAASAAPPPADTRVNPSTVNWKPPISTFVSYIISIEEASSSYIPNPKYTSSDGCSGQFSGSHSNVPSQHSVG